MIGSSVAPAIRVRTFGRHPVYTPIPLLLHFIEGIGTHDCVFKVFCLLMTLFGQQTRNLINDL